MGAIYGGLILLVNSNIDIDEFKENEDDEESLMMMYEGRPDECMFHNHNYFSLYMIIMVYVYSNTGKVSLKMILSFFTGADDIPPMGYAHAPELNFNPNSPYPTSSTCALQLTLPTRYSDYGPYKQALDTAFTMHGGFGLA